MQRQSPSTRKDTAGVLSWHTASAWTSRNRAKKSKTTLGLSCSCVPRVKVQPHLTKAAYQLQGHFSLLSQEICFNTLIILVAPMCPSASATKSFLRCGSHSSSLEILQRSSWSAFMLLCCLFIKCRPCLSRGFYAPIPGRFSKIITHKLAHLIAHSRLLS